jgi:endonuclease YncB( thermonuclease family)
MEAVRSTTSQFRGNGSEIITAVLFPRPRREIGSAEDLRDALSKVKDGDTISLFVYDVQAQGTRVVSITIGDQ